MSSTTILSKNIQVTKNNTINVFVEFITPKNSDCKPFANVSLNINSESVGNYTTRDYTKNNIEHFFERVENIVEKVYYDNTKLILMSSGEKEDMKYWGDKNRAIESLIALKSYANKIRNEYISNE